MACLQRKLELITSMLAHERKWILICVFESLLSNGPDDTLLPQNG